MTTASSDRFDVVVIGAGAAGLFCAIEAGKRGRSVLVVDHAKAPGEKIRISGGGRCNFTNLHASPKNFLSDNPQFCISALSRFRPVDFIVLVDRHGIAWHEKTLGQLFCDGSARQIVGMLMDDLRAVGAELRLSTTVGSVERDADGFHIETSGGSVAASALVVATGGLSIPKMGATGFAYELARRFDLSVVPTRPGLVPLTLADDLLETVKPLAGVSLDAAVSCGKVRFEEAMLFTHRGLSGPAILQISSFWRQGGAIVIDMAPAIDLFEHLRRARSERGRQSLSTILGDLLPRRLVERLVERVGREGRLADFSDKALREVEAAVRRWEVRPAGSEGYRTAEVTLGGIDTRALDSKTMQAKSVPGLYFIGEAVDVTGWLGGYNFQWAWSSGWCAGQAA